jgi:hypothetical protein
MAASPSIPSAPPRWPQTGAPRRPRRWPTIAWLVAITLVASVAVVGWLRPLHDHQPPPASAAPTYTEQQVANAKANVCGAFGKVDRALEGAQSLGGSSDPTAILAVATSAREALDFGSRYLPATLAEEPATPSDLAAAVPKQADAYQKLVIGYMDGLHYVDPDLQPAASASAEATATLRRLCK